MNFNSGCWSWAPDSRRFTLLRIRYGNSRSYKHTYTQTNSQ